ncbi:nuclear transport factor 2 family protein [Nocardia sp. KC 131]|uniref:nuclear transport factor 2 family protein n=1 Tax=Nocardia arseniciresistens TaxID=3392119 RepID=UPI00398F0CC7
MNQAVVDAMWDYLAAGLAMDVAKLDELYDPDFVNVRTDAAGRSVIISKAQFMARFRAMRVRGQSVSESIDDVSFPATAVFDDYAAIVMRRVQGGVPVLCTFIWQLRDGKPTTILREFSSGKDIGYLLKMFEAA